MKAKVLFIKILERFGVFISGKKFERVPDKIDFLIKGIKNPIKALRYIFRSLDNKFKFTETAKVSGGGERLVIKNWRSAKSSKDFTLAHIQRYEWVLPYVKGLRCLEIGCGCGYGTNYLAKNNVNMIIGVDISSDAIKFAKKYYRLENLGFLQMDALNLKFENNSFDAVICFEVLEHLREEHQYRLLTEFVRILKDGGALYITSPNAAIHRGGYPFHYKELTRREFEWLLYKFYKNVNIFGQDLIVNGIRQKEHWRKYQFNLSYQNFIIVEDDIDSCWGLLAICKNKRRLKEDYRLNKVSK
jgi:2-polyprenyl-3-methyl-5-hydroxy-6-metoxy-1,4-benzoquinol methylase